MLLLLLVLIVILVCDSQRLGLFTFSGKNVVAVDSPIGRLGLTVCYDLRFPEIYQLLRFQHDAQVKLHFLFAGLKLYGVI